jgi:hypothetical protein
MEEFEMSGIISERWKHDPGKIAGVFYLMVTLLAIVGALRFIVIPGQTIDDTVILLARIGFFVEMIHIIFFLLLAWALYIVFSTVNKSQAMLVTLSITVSVAIQALNTLTNYAAFSLLTDTQFLDVFSIEQIEVLATFYIELHTVGTNIATFFWFLWLFVAGYLVFNSEILHKYLGVLLMIGGVGYLLILIEFFIVPGAVFLNMAGALTAGIAEISLMLWLLVKGANRKDLNDTITESQTG